MGRVRSFATPLRSAALALGAVFVCNAPPALAQELHVDVMFQEDEDGRLGVHGRNWDQLPEFQAIEGKRVYGRSFQLSGNSLVQDDPGFTATANPAVIDPLNLGPPKSNENVRFDIVAVPDLGGRNLSYWDGSGAVSWGPVPDDEGIEISSFAFRDPDGRGSGRGSDSAVADGSASPVPGFVIDATDGAGALHRHIDFRLLPDNAQLPPAGPDDGVYLVMLEATQESYAEWIPFYVLLEAFAGGDAAVAAAIADVEANLLAPLCDDGIDNDRDGLIDSPADGGCQDANGMSERLGPNECDNGVDDDLDGFVDFPNDPDCPSAFATLELPEPGPTSGSIAVAAALGLLHRLRGARGDPAGRGSDVPMKPPQQKGRMHE